jgi:paraquat-inducible protein A
MKTFPDLTVCEHCDSVYRRRPLAPGETARCARCAAPLYRASRLDVDRWLALAAAGLWATAGLMALITLIANRSVHRLRGLAERDVAIHAAVQSSETLKQAQGRLDCHGPAALAMTSVIRYALSFVNLL